MGKFYDQPVIEQTNTTVESPPEVKKPTNTAITLKDLYIKQLDELDQFAKGEIGFQNATARQEKLIDIIRSFDSMLSGSYRNVKPAFHHLIGVINRSPVLYGSGEIFAPLYTMKTIPYKIKPERFIDLFCFFIGIAENIRDVKRYIGGRDIPYFLKDFSVTQRENIVRFIEDLTHR